MKCSCVGIELRPGEMDLYCGAIDHPFPEQCCCSGKLECSRLLLGNAGAVSCSAGPNVAISAADVRNPCPQNPVSLVTEGSRQFTTLSTRGSTRDCDQLVTISRTGRIPCPAPRPLSVASLWVQVWSTFSIRNGGAYAGQS